MVNNWANRARARRQRRGGHLRCELAVVDDEEKGALAIARVADGLSESVFSGCTRVRQPFPSAALIYFLYYIILYIIIKTLPRHSIPIFSYSLRFFSLHQYTHHGQGRDC